MLKTTPRVNPHCAKYTRSAGQHWGSSYWRYTHKCKAPQMYVSWLGYHLAILWHHSSSGTFLPHNFYTEICKAWYSMVRHGVVPTKLKNRHLTLKQDLHYIRELFSVLCEPKITMLPCRAYRLAASSWGVQLPVQICSPLT